MYSTRVQPYLMRGLRTTNRTPIEGSEKDSDNITRDYKCKGYAVWIMERMTCGETACERWKWSNERYGG
jgi:hypothetical protein